MKPWHGNLAECSIRPQFWSRLFVYICVCVRACVHVCGVHVHMCTMCVPDLHVVDPRELKLHMVGSHHLSECWESQWFSTRATSIQWLSHLSSPQLFW